jgi:pimeloyl-ACP methyl ester carboxylesterase
VSRGWKILIAALAVIAVLLALNTITVDNETKSAGVTAEEGRILELSGGDMQIVETPAQTDKPGAPIVLIHCYACSLHWWDSIVPLLSKDHRVITLDLLGHGGSAKPSSGYTMEDQAGVVAEALNQLQVQGAVVVGHSLGAYVATALAGQSSELVDRVVDIDAAPDTEHFGQGLPFLAKLGYVPVIGQLLSRVTPDFAVKDSYEDAFAPGYDIESGFENPDQVVDDYRAMTYTSFKRSHVDAESYTDDVPLDERLKDAAVPLLVIFGAEDQIADPDESLAGFQDVPGARTATVEDAGHSPNVEQPEQTARLILEFAADAGDEVLPPPPSQAGGTENGGREHQRIKGKGRKARQKEEAQEQAPNGNKNNADGGGAGGGSPNAEKGQKPPSDHRPGGNQTD